MSAQGKVELSRIDMPNPYDAIIAAAGGEALPPAWTDQLAEGGRLVAPMHDMASGGQVLLARTQAGEMGSFGVLSDPAGAAFAVFEGDFDD